MIEGCYFYNRTYIIGILKGGDAVKANKDELRRAEDKLDRILTLLTSDQQRSL